MEGAEATGDRRGLGNTFGFQEAETPSYSHQVYGHEIHVLSADDTKTLCLLDRLNMICSLKPE